jgi:hypothetical protein
MGKACSKNEEKRNACGVLVEKAEGKKPLGRLRRRWVDNIKVDPRVTGWGGMDYIDMTQDRNK